MQEIISKINNDNVAFFYTLFGGFLFGSFYLIIGLFDVIFTFLRRKISKKYVKVEEK